VQYLSAGAAYRNRSRAAITSLSLPANKESMLSFSQLGSGQACGASDPGPLPRRRLAEADAIDIWIARWLGIRRKDLVARYACDPRRLYEIWEEARFPGSRDKAKAVLAERYPALVDRIDYGLHRRIPRRVPAEMQPDLFDPACADARLFGG